MTRHAPRLLLIALASCRPSPPPTHGLPGDAGLRVITVDTALLSSGRIALGGVVRRTPANELRVPGQVNSSEDGSAEAGVLVSGRMAVIAVHEGDTVTRSQVLAWVDAPEASRATAEVLRARARADVAGKRLARQLRLQEQAATSAGAVDDARAEDAVARADLSAARTLLATFDVKEPATDNDGGALVVRVPVRAPIAGIVAHHDAVLGGAVSPDKALFHIVDDSHVFVMANVPETAEIPPDGSAASFVARGAPDRRCAATVASSLRVVDSVTRAVSVRLHTSSPCKWLAPGAYVDVVLPVASTARPELVVPAEAIVDVEGVPTAFVQATEPGQFTARGVRTRATGGPDAVIEAGLSEGERVATAGALLLKGELLRAALRGD